MSRSKSDDLGRIRSGLKGSVTAGSHQSWSITYSAGFAGIDDTGSLKVVMRYATDAGTPQFDDPRAANYVSATASNGARLQLRYNVKDNIRPWGKTLHVKVLQGFLREGDTITVTFGDRAQGSPGWRMQTFAERTFELRVLVDRYATYCYDLVPGSPTVRIVAGDPVKLVAVAPSVCRPNRRIALRYKLEDKWGNPVGRAKRLNHSGFAESGFQTIHVTDDETGLAAETNPIRITDNATDSFFWADLHGQSEETIGTNSIEDYFRFARDFAFVDACGHQGNDFQITDEFWSTIQETTRRFNKPGRFVTFPGWEWSGNTALGGDRNVLFIDEGGPIARSSRALVDEPESADPCAETVEDLFRRMRKSSVDAMLIPHVGGRYADINRHDSRLEPVVEVHSAWGTFEWMLDDTFRNGDRIGIVANSDGHKGRPGASYPGAGVFGSYGGLTCIRAARLDRESVWDAYRSRRVYATTGARILLDVHADDSTPMGAVVRLARNRHPVVSFSVCGTAPIERVELWNGMRVVKTFRTCTADDLTNRVKVLWQGAAVRGRGRQVVWDGRLKLHGSPISSFQTINFHNHELPCRKTGRDRLEWRSVTTGGVAGVIVDSGGTAKTSAVSVETAGRTFEVDLKSLSIRGRRWKLGGLGKMLSINRLPAANGTRRIEEQYQLEQRDLTAGDNPILIKVVQEDGHMAWSSPIYFVRPT